MKTILEEKNIVFLKISTMDEVGRVFLYNDRILRSIYSLEYADLYRHLLKETWFDDVFKAGLVKTWICEDVEIEGVPLILEHSRIPFETHPAECTSLMHWLCAKTMMRINLELSQRGYSLRDSHPWNLMYNKGYPQFIDFSSITKSSRITSSWLKEFIQYFGVPIRLSSIKWNSSTWKALSLEYRRQHTVGFGLKLFSAGVLRKLLLGSLTGISRYYNQPYTFFTKLDKWLERHKPPKSEKKTWANYPHYLTAKDPLEPKTVKQKFLYNVLLHEKPARVLDCAANKGYYSEMAALLGASVLAVDYEEFCVDTCLRLAQSKELDITPAIMDLKLPTPNFGMGLMKGSAFARFEVDIVLAYGLAHHLCIAQRLPVNMFCEIFMKYAKRGVVMEYVDPRDKHVLVWEKPVPKDYSLEAFCGFFSKKFQAVEKSEIVSEDGLCRTYVFFHN